jgi:cytidine deaminase
MALKLTRSEKRLVAYARRAIVKYNTIRRRQRGLDTLYSFLLSTSGNVYDGACFEPGISHASVCGERHAIANLVMNESYTARIRAILIADPVPQVQDKSTTPCGTCRHLIWTYAAPDTTLILMQYIPGKSSWNFPKIEKYTIKELYPHPYESADRHLWDNFVPQ